MAGSTHTSTAYTRELTLFWGESEAGGVPDPSGKPGQLSILHVVLEARAPTSLRASAPMARCQEVGRGPIGG